MSVYLRHLPLIGNCFEYEDSKKKKHHDQPARCSLITVTGVREANVTQKKIFAVALIVLLLFGLFLPVIFPETPLGAGRVNISTNNHSNVRFRLQPYVDRLTLKTPP